ncbi:hypothetical protein JZ751_009142 [Albula glossodonta]|uniref:Low molecular weight phosphotyrosine protein phosphatase n=1 Tax=Albula glossodonta TaxID=121402 RepID=A0A8T2NCB6_9TELE|nr:hypothetical protein JZ751_009142 [Albula glossodonta]
MEAQTKRLAFPCQTHHIPQINCDKLLVSLKLVSCRNCVSSTTGLAVSAAASALLWASADLNKKANAVKSSKAKIELLGSYDPQKQLIIKDPYYGSEEDFEMVYEQCLRCCKVFLESHS